MGANTNTPSLSEPHFLRVSNLSLSAQGLSRASLKLEEALLERCVLWLHQPQGHLESNARYSGAAAAGHDFAFLDVSMNEWCTSVLAEDAGCVGLLTHYHYSLHISSICGILMSLFSIFVRNTTTAAYLSCTSYK